MGYHSAVVGVLALAVFASASIGDNSLESGERAERVVLVSPVLAPFQDTKIPSSVRARQFPILVLLAQSNPEYSREQQAKSLEENPQPIYVQKLEDQVQPQQQYVARPPKKLNRHRRSPHHFKKHWGGGGGGYAQPVYVQPQPVYVQPQPVYHSPPVQKTIIVKFEGGHGGGYGGHGGGYGGHGGGYGGHGGGYGGGHGGGGGCGGGCGGGGGYSQSQAYASASASAQASSYSGYGKK